MTATETNPGLKSDSRAIQVAKKNTEIAGKGKSIKISLGASASTGLQAWESKKYGSQLKNGYSHSVSLNINIPIIDGGATETDMQWKAAILQVEAENEALQVAEEQRNVGALTYTDYLTQKNRLESAQSTLTNAKYTSLLARNLLDLYQGKLD